MSNEPLQHMDRDTLSALADQGAAAPPVDDETWAASRAWQLQSAVVYLQGGSNEAARTWKIITGRAPTRWEQWILDWGVIHYGEVYTARAIHCVASRSGYGMRPLESTRADGLADIEVKATAVWDLLERWGFEARVGLGS